MASNLIPSPKWTVPGNSGNVATGWKIYTYEVGNLVEKPTYTTATQGTANSNPVILDSRGEADIWWNGAYKIVIKDENDNTINTIDNYTASQELTQWITAVTSTFATTTTFTIAGNLVSTYEIGRRVLLNDLTILYGTITGSSYSSPNTTVTVALDSGNLSSSLTTSQLGILTASNTSIPDKAFRGCLVYSTAAMSYTASITTLSWDTESYDTDSIHSTSINPSRLTVPAGITKIRLNWAQSVGSNDVSNTQNSFRLQKNGTTLFYRIEPTVPTGNSMGAFIGSSPVITVVAGDYFEIKMVSAVGITALLVGNEGTSFGMEIIE